MSCRVRRLTLSIVLCGASFGSVFPAHAGALLRTGTEFRINEATSEHQQVNQMEHSGRAVAVANDRSFVVVWRGSTEGEASDNYLDVFARIFDPVGNPIGPDFKVNTIVTDEQGPPTVSMAADKSFVVAWSGADRLSVRRFSSVGVPLTDEVEVVTLDAYGLDRTYSISSAPDGSFVLAWDDYDETLLDPTPDEYADQYDPWEIYAQKFDASATPVGARFMVNQATDRIQSSPAVSVADDGSFVIAWESSGYFSYFGNPNSDDVTEYGDGYMGGVFARKFNLLGAPLGPEFILNTTTLGHQAAPFVESNDDGSFQAVWEHRTQDESGFYSGTGVRGQRFDASGARIGSEIEILPPSGHAGNNPTVTSDNGHGFLVVWDSIGGPTSMGQPWDVYGKYHDESGAAVGTEFRVNTYDTNAQLDASVAANRRGDYVVVWSSERQDGSGYGVYGEVMCVDGDSDGACDSSNVCPSAPAPGCITGLSASFQVKNSDNDESDKISWKLSKGDFVEQGDLGDPQSARTYALCIYDQASSTSSLVASLDVPPGWYWQNVDPKGFKYTDRGGFYDGITKIQIKTGDAGRSSAKISAKGTAIPMPDPVSGSQYFHKDASVVVQLVNNQSSDCWTTEFSTASKNDGAMFKAKLP